VRGKQIEDRQEMVITILYAEMAKAVQNRQGSVGKSSMILIPCNYKVSSQTAIQPRPMNQGLFGSNLTKLPGPGSNPRRPISSAWGRMVLPGRRAAWQAATKQALRNARLIQ